jgi:hypothetical protein
LHAGTFEDTLRLAGCLVDDRWDASVRCRKQSLVLVCNRINTVRYDLSSSRLISRNHGSFCWFLLNSSLCTLYWRPNSSSVMEILCLVYVSERHKSYCSMVYNCPLGVPAFNYLISSFYCSDLFGYF